MPAVLTSWKEIAAHLGKSIRTVQRWERELALPVRRPDLRRSGIVLAVPEELDQWLQRCMVPAPPASELGLREPHPELMEILAAARSALQRTFELQMEARALREALEKVTQPAPPPGPARSRRNQPAA